MIIGITGKAGAGKTTAANMLIKEFNNKAIIIPFAKPLKDFARKLGWNGKKDEKGRRLLQLLGTDVARKCIDEDIWVQHWKKFQEEYDSFENLDGTKDCDHYIADDVRFANEADFILGQKGLVIKIVGREYDNVDSTHESEQDIPNYLIDCVIDNNSDLEDLKVKVAHFVNSNIKEQL